MKYRVEIDGLRALAIVPVVLFHAGFELFSGGYVGVDVFFVISGYLMTSIILNELEEGRFSICDFYSRRAKRLLPAFYFTLLVTFIASYFLLSPTLFKNFGFSLGSSTLLVPNISFWLESGYFNEDAYTKPLLHMWSLGVEAQFYLIWPILLFFLFKNLKKFWLFGVRLLLGLFSLFMNEWMLILNESNAAENWADERIEAAIYFLTPFRLFEFSVGALLSFASRYQIVNKIALEVLQILGILAIIYAVVFFDNTTTFPSFNALIPCIGAALLIYSSNARFSSFILKNRLAVGLGKVSYSLYLIHWPIIVLYSYWKGDSLTLEESLILCAASIGSAVFIYFYVEHILRKRNSFFSLYNTHTKLALFIVTISFVLLSGSVWLNEGWKFRLGDDRIALIEQFETKGQSVSYGGSLCKGNCKKGGEESKVALVGRSHARHYANGLLESGIPFDFFNVDCPIFFGDYCNDQKGADTAFEQRNNILNVLKDYDRIIFSEVLRYSVKTVKNMKEDRNIEFQSYSDWLEFIAARIGQFRNNFPDKELIWIGETPRVGYNFQPLECLARPFPTKICVVTPMEKHQRWFDLNLELKKIASENDIVFLNPHEFLCTTDGCKNMIGDFPIYSDYHHFSDWGSRYLSGKMLAPVLKH